MDHLASRPGRRRRDRRRALRAHDLRRTCAKLCRKSGGNLEQIKCLLGHASIQTTEHYLGAEQELGILNCFVSCRMRIRTRPDSRECSPQGAVQSSGGPLELSRPGRPREDSVDEPLPA